MARAKATRKKKRSRLNSYIYSFFSLLLIVFGACLLIVASFKSFGLEIFTSPSPMPSVAINPRAAAKPVKIFIPKITKTLDIMPGEVVDNRWTVAENGVSFLTTSATPGNVGNSVMYGHNKLQVLGDLQRVASGDVVEITMDNGAVYKYRIFETKVIKPTEVEVLDSSSDARLTIYTCSGFLDQARFVVVARLEDI